jgi:hypothetical protein
MAVVTTTIVQVKPDRFQDWLDVMRKVNPIMEKAGAKNIRILAGLVAGEATGIVVVTMESDDFGSAGAMMDKTFSDPEIQKALALGEGNPMIGWQTSQFIDVPL